MTQEEKELLVKDLSARLGYGVKCTTKSSSWNGVYTIVGYKDDRFFLDCPIYDEGDDEWMIESIVPYLRPMPSMTEEEKKEYWDITSVSNHCAAIDWLNAHHFDYRGLIEKGLAIAVTEDNNPYKQLEEGV